MSKEEKPRKAYISSGLQENSSKKQISIAPMMDWTNIANNLLKQNKSQICDGNMLAHKIFFSTI